MWTSRPLFEYSVHVQVKIWYTWKKLLEELIHSSSVKQIKLTVTLAQANVSTTYQFQARAADRCQYFPITTFKLKIIYIFIYQVLNLYINKYARVLWWIYCGYHSVFCRGCWAAIFAHFGIVALAAGNALWSRLTATYDGLVGLAILLVHYDVDYWVDTRRDVYQKVAKHIKVWVFFVMASNLKLQAKRYLVLFILQTSLF